MAKYNQTLSHFDLDQKRGTQAELWVSDIRDAILTGSDTIECKRDAYFLSQTSEDYYHRGVNPPRLYIETECRGRDGIWRHSGINTTKATLWVIKFGEHQGGLIIDTAWLKKAVEHARLDSKNIGYCQYGENPTRGVYVYMKTILETRDRALDEH